MKTHLSLINFLIIILSLLVELSLSYDTQTKEDIMQKACLKVSTENIRTLLFVSRLWANNPIGERIHIKCQLDSFRDCMKNLTFNQAIDVLIKPKEELVEVYDNMSLIMNSCRSIWYHDMTNAGYRGRPPNSPPQPATAEQMLYFQSLLQVWTKNIIFENEKKEEQSVFFMTVYYNKIVNYVLSIYNEIKMYFERDEQAQVLIYGFAFLLIIIIVKKTIRARNARRERGHLKIN